MELVTLFVEWMVSVAEHWHGWVSGGILAFGLEIAEKVWEFKTTKKVFVLILALGFVWSIFASWKDEHDKVSAQLPYVETTAQPNTTQFPDPRLRLGMNVFWKNVSQFPAFNFKQHGQSYLRPNHSEETQAALIEEFKQWVRAEFKNDRSEGVTLYPNTGPRQQTEYGPQLTPDDAAKITEGTEIVFVLAASQFVDGAARKWESHACYYLEPRGSLPHDIIAITNMNYCMAYTSIVRIDY